MSIDLNKARDNACDRKTCKSISSYARVSQAHIPQTQYWSLDSNSYSLEIVQIVNFNGKNCISRLPWSIIDLFAQFRAFAIQQNARPTLTSFSLSVDRCCQSVQCRGAQEGQTWQRHRKVQQCLIYLAPLPPATAIGASAFSSRCWSRNTSIYSVASSDFLSIGLGYAFVYFS